MSQKTVKTVNFGYTVVTMNNTAVNVVVVV